MNESSLQDEGQESGPVCIPSEPFTKLPRTHTQSKPSYSGPDPVGIIDLPTWITGVSWEHAFVCDSRNEGKKPYLWLQMST